MSLLHVCQRLGGVLGLTHDLERSVDEWGLRIEGDVQHGVGVVRVSSLRHMLLRLTYRLISRLPREPFWSHGLSLSASPIKLAQVC
jgi:hypothetical protein